MLITGGSGFIGSNFLLHVSGLKDIRIIAPRHGELDILNLDQLNKIFEKFCPDVIVNFAAHRDASSAEIQRGNSEGSVWKTNVASVENISRVSSTHRSFLIHISTDMVFSGRKEHKGPYSEQAVPENSANHLSWYGWTKREAERTLQDNKHAAIVRIGNVTQPVYDPKLDYVGKILYLFNKGELYPLFDDQFLTLTPIPLLCRLIEALGIQQKPGIYHVATSDLFTPYELGDYLIEKMFGKAKGLPRMSIASYLKKAPHRYPQYGGLLSSYTQRELGIAMPPWREVIDASIDSFHQGIDDAA